MLILTRSPGQSINIGDDIVINVVQIKNNQVRIAVEAPREVEVYRDEIYERIDKERKESKGVSDIGPDSRIGTRR